jgi:hypothetical protein
MSELWILLDDSCTREIALGWIRRSSGLDPKLTVVEFDRRCWVLARGSISTGGIACYGRSLCEPGGDASIESLNASIACARYCGFLSRLTSVVM